MSQQRMDNLTYYTICIQTCSNFRHHYTTRAFLHEVSVLPRLMKTKKGRPIASQVSI